MMSPSPLAGTRMPATSSLYLFLASGCQRSSAEDGGLMTQKNRAVCRCGVSGEKSPFAMSGCISSPLGGTNSKPANARNHAPSRQVKSLLYLQTPVGVAC